MAYIFVRPVCAARDGENVQEAASPAAASRAAAADTAVGSPPTPPLALLSLRSPIRSPKRKSHEESSRAQVHGSPPKKPARQLAAGASQTQVHSDVVFKTSYTLVSHSCCKERESCTRILPYFGLQLQLDKTRSTQKMYSSSRLSQARCSTVTKLRVAEVMSKLECSGFTLLPALNILRGEQCQRQPDL